METTRTLKPPYQLRRSGFLCDIHQVHMLSESFDATVLTELVATDRLRVSGDGLNVAIVERVDETTERVAHNIRRVCMPKFSSCDQAGTVRTRILNVAADRLLVWGLPEGASVRGVYEICTGRRHVKLVRPFAELHRVCRLPHGLILVGVGGEDSGSGHLWTEHGVLPVQEIASTISVSDGSFLFLEQINGKSYRYRFGANGFVDWFPIAQRQGEIPVAIAYVQNQYVLATHTASGSRLRVIGSRNSLSFPLMETWPTKIEQLWVSPSERSLAWLVNLDANDPMQRALYVNGQRVYHGEFSMEQTDLVWASSSSEFGAKITKQDASGQEQQSIITQEGEREFPPGTFLREFLIDTDGTIAATITDDGELCYPLIYDRALQSVPIAWNLHWASGGGIGYNTVLPESIVCLTVDETEVLRH